MQPQGAARRLGRHVRVAVAVAADPRTELEDCRHIGRPRPGGARIGGRRIVQSVEPAAPPAVRLRVPIQGGIERPVQLRGEGEERFVKERQGRPNLVQRRRGDGPQVRRPPEERDLLAQAAPEVAVLAGRQARVAEPFKQPVAAAQRNEERPAARLGRVGREDGGHPQAPDQRDDVRPAPAAPEQRPGGVADGFVELAAWSGPRPAPQRPDSLALLGEVDELEVKGEGADQRLHPAQVKRIELLRRGSTVRPGRPGDGG